MNLELHNADCMEVMARYPDNYFDLAVVDPPYGIGMAKTTNIANTKRGFNGEKIHEAKKWDSEIPPEEYFKELKRTSKNQVIWGGNYFTKYLEPTKSWVFWNKKENRTQGKNFSDGELAWTSTKTLTRMFEFGWIGLDYCNQSEKKIHPTQKPVELYKWIYQNYAKDGMRILDTHLGSGSNAIAAYEMNMGEFVGCELDEDYFADAKKRIDNALSQQKLFA